MRQLKLPSGNVMPVFGLGTWRMGEHPDRFQAEVDVIRGVLDLGITLSIPPKCMVRVARKK
jgi:diketogulonate reductase-like aldo/keto reductase